MFMINSPNEHEIFNNLFFLFIRNQELDFRCMAFSSVKRSYLFFLVEIINFKYWKIFKLCKWWEMVYVIPNHLPEISRWVIVIKILKCLFISRLCCSLSLSFEFVYCSKFQMVEFNVNNMLLLIMIHMKQLRFNNYTDDLSIHYLCRKFTFNLQNM